MLGAQAYAPPHSNQRSVDSSGSGWLRHDELKHIGHAKLLLDKTQQLLREIRIDAP